MIRYEAAVSSLPAARHSCLWERFNMNVIIVLTNQNKSTNEGKN